jgi:hypothetical protein
MVKYLTMIIPSIQGEFNQNEFFIYSAADEKYFDEFVPALSNSVKQNTKHSLHLHLYNPRPDQIEFCQNNDITWTAEYIPLELFDQATQKFDNSDTDEVLKSQKLRITTAMTKGGDKSLRERLRKTYFACARFIRLKDFANPRQKFLAIDVDAIVRNNFPLLGGKDFYIHYISGKKARYLAGGIFYTGENFDFFHQYGDLLENYIKNDKIHWGLDQDVLDNLVPNYNWGQLPIRYIDWEMDLSSYIWTAKGQRKDLDVFLNEKSKYTT